MLGVTKSMRGLWWLLPPLVISAIPGLWMAIIWYAQLLNVLSEAPYWREFPFVTAFWIGLLAAMRFAWKHVRSLELHPISKLNIALIVLGIAGGAWEGVTLIDDPKVGLPVWLLVLAPASWLIVGLLARATPNQRLESDA